MYYNNKDNFRLHANTKSHCIKKSKLANPLFTVVIPTYGRADLLKEALQSCLDQTYTNAYEILVVDNDPVRNNETELLIDSIDDLRLSYYKNENNIGCLGNFNRCIELTSSEYLIMLHTDDLLDSAFLSTIIPVIEKHPGIDMLIPAKKILRNNRMENQKGYVKLAALSGISSRGVKLDVRDFSLYNITGGPLGIVMRKSMCLELGGFDESIFPMSDYSFWTRASLSYNVVHLPMRLGVYRFIESISLNSGMQFSYIENEYNFIKSLINQKKYENAFKDYLAEYIKYRLRKSGLYNHKNYSKITGRPHKFNVIKKIRYFSVIVYMSLSYIKRALKSEIKA